MTRQQCFTKQLLTTGVAVTATLVLSAPVLADPNVANMIVGPQCDVVFGVNDSGLNNSRIVFMADDGTGVTPIGPEYPGYDLEAMDIDANNVLYAASGDDVTNGKPGHLFKVNRATAALTDAVSIVCDDVKIQEVDGISFNLADNTLWGWGQDQGLFQILRGADGELDMSTCKIFLAVPVDAPDKKSYNDELEDLTWDNEGKILYAVGNVDDGDHDEGTDADKPRAVVAFSPATSAIEQICRAELEPVTDEIEGIEMQPDGSIMFTYHNEDKVSVNGYINPKNCKLYTGTDVPNTPYNDIEALACCVELPLNLDWEYQIDAVPDQTGSTKLEIYGMAVEIDNGVMTVAIQANMDESAATRLQHNRATDGYVSFSDMVFDLAGEKYAVKFAESNNSDVASTGLYKDVTFKDVSAENNGYASFKAYGAALTKLGIPAADESPPYRILGDLELKNNYFSWDAIRSVPMSIKTGTKVGDITTLNETQLAAMGLDFASNGISGGTYTFGFSFTMTAKMIADARSAGGFLAYFFSECINDGMAIEVKQIDSTC